MSTLLSRGDKTVFSRPVQPRERRGQWGGRRWVILLRKKKNKEKNKKPTKHQPTFYLRSAFRHSLHDYAVLHLAGPSVLEEPLRVCVCVPSRAWGHGVSLTFPMPLGDRKRSVGRGSLFLSTSHNCRFLGGEKN